jgi:hypothetical protein
MPGFEFWNPNQKLFRSKKCKSSNSVVSLKYNFFCRFCLLDFTIMYIHVFPF